MFWCFYDDSKSFLAVFQVCTFVIFADTERKRSTMRSFTIEGTIILPVEGRIICGEVEVTEGKISSVVEKETKEERLIMPGLVDAHVHIESSMLVPSEFACAAVVHGTTATVSDPHEIANVLGMEGVAFMISNGAMTPFRFCFGAPSCVPATPLESAGAVLGPVEVLQLLEKKEVYYLAEMMNYPGVIHGDPEVHAKLEHAHRLGKPVDGHAPGLTGEALKRYVEAGITTDHECFTLEEAREKAKLGMKILIREGSAARNFEELLPLLKEFPDMVMFCSDDKHPDELLNGHINQLISRGLKLGYPLMDLVRACTLNPVSHYGLGCGLLRVGDPADLIIVEDAEQFSVNATYIGGVLVAQNGKSLIKRVEVETPNRFEAGYCKPEDFRVQAQSDRVRVIGAVDGQLVTSSMAMTLPVADGLLQCDIIQDVLKLVVINRYQQAPPAVAFIHGFGLKQGALASTVAHDSHNIIAVGTDDHWISEAVNLIVENRGGLSAVAKNFKEILPLPVAGIMASLDINSVAEKYQHIDMFAKSMGTPLHAPFMTLSFMALLVIPDLKLGDKGLFDGKNFIFTDIFIK
jgi:adenine deaminase